MNSRKMRFVVIGLVIVLASGMVAIGSLAQAADDVRVLVGFRGTPDASVIHQAAGKVHRIFQLVPAIAATVPAQAIQGLEHNPKVEYVEEDRVVQAVAYTSGEIVPWGIDRIGAPTVYNGGNAGDGIKVAVLDTGIDSTHPDLFTNYADGYNCLTNGATPPKDDNGHGTHVSGTIAAADNTFGVVGVGPRISLHAIKFLNANGSGYTSDEIEGIQWATENGIQVLNMSFGSSRGSLAEQQALDAAYNDHNMLLVAAAGNSGNSRVLYPAVYGSVIAVAATTEADQRASFSCFYPDVELAAPGVGVYSTYMGGGYASLSGTSMATPHVSGAAALVFGKNKDLNWSNVQVRNQLNSTATDLGPVGRDVYFGYGLVNAAAACSGTVPPVSGTGTITGTVFLNLVPVSKASVTLLDQTGASVATTKTDTSGVYAFNNVPAPSAYKVKAQSKRYSTTSGLRDLEVGQTVVQDLYLQ